MNLAISIVPKLDLRNQKCLKQLNPERNIEQAQHIYKLATIPFAHAARSLNYEEIHH